MPDVLSQRALNRALLARQLLLRRTKKPVLATIEHLVGMQAQNPLDPYTGLWSRLEGFRPDELSELITDRRAVRIGLMRTTIHLVSAEDCLYLRPLTQPLSVRTFGSTAFAKRLPGLDMAEVAAVGRALVEERARTGPELGRLMAERFPGNDPGSLAWAVRYLLPLVQVPPRGVWGKSGPPTTTTAESWLGRPLQTDADAAALVRRYLAAFGPATVADMRNWSGVSGLREVVGPIRGELRVIRDAAGRELLDVPHGLLPDPETPAPPRFLAEYDNVLLGHEDRSRIVSREDQQLVMSTYSGSVGGLLVDGFAGGTWRIVRTRGAARLEINPLRRLSAADRADVADEGARLLAFLAGDSQDHDVDFRPILGS